MSKEFPLKPYRDQMSCISSVVMMIVRTTNLYYRILHSRGGWWARLGRPVESSTMPISSSPPSEAGMEQAQLIFLPCIRFAISLEG